MLIMLLSKTPNKSQTFMSYRHRQNKSKLSHRGIPSVSSQQSANTTGATSPKQSATPQNDDDTLGQVRANKAPDLDNMTYQNMPEGNLDGNAVYTEVDKNLKKKNRPPGVDRSNNWTDQKQNGSEGKEKGTKGWELEGQYDLAKTVSGVGSDMEEGEATEMIENPYYDGSG